jgi:hypothetical protein
MARHRGFYGPDLTISVPGPNSEVGFTGTPSHLQTTVSGTVSAKHPPLANSVTSMAYSIDDGPTFSIPPPTGTGHDWTFNLQGNNCDPPNSYHTLTVFAWDKTGVNSLSRTFFRTT